MSFSNKLYAQRVDLESAHHGCVEFRREQVRLQEELVMKEKALPETRIRKYARATSRRIFCTKLREGHETIQRLTSQVPELQDGRFV